MSEEQDRRSPADRSSDKLDELLSELLDGDFTAAHHAMLQEALREDSEARRRYLRFMQIHAKLQWSTGQAFGQVDPSGAISPQDDSDVTEALTLADLAALMHQEAHAETISLQSNAAKARQWPEPTAESQDFRRVISTLRDPDFARYVLGQLVRSKPARGIAVAAGLALALLLAVSLIRTGAPSPQTASNQTPAAEEIAGQQTPQNPVATLTDQSEAVWDRQPESSLYAGQRFSLIEGFAEITTHRGAVAILQAPATFEMLDHDNALYLHSGKLVGLCHATLSKGFTVKTDHADITDIGTEFGVEVQNDRLDACVFVGVIHVKLPNGHSHEITTNRTARISYAGGLPHLVVEDEIEQGYTRRTPRPRLVTHASINLPDFDVNVLPQAVYEDVKLFTDRDHQLNGIDQKGLPGFLIGADLIQMPASARAELHPHVGNRLELQIDVSSPAEIYLLIEIGSKLEPWIEQHYVKTTMKAGNDHGSVEDGKRLGVGPGISIDRTFEIWKRKTPVTGRTVIGGAIDGTMYAVLARPLPPAEAEGTR